MTDKDPNPAQEAPLLPREESAQTNPTRVAILRALADIALFVFYVFLARQGTAWQMSQLAVLGLALVLLDLAGLALIWRGRPRLGASLVILALFPVALITNALISGLGVMLGLSVIVLTALASIQALPPRAAGRLTLFGLAVGIASPILDGFLPTLSRLAVPSTLASFYPAVVGLLVILFMLLTARQYSNFTLRTKLVIAFLLVALVPLAVLAFINARANTNALTQAANQALFAAASKTASNLDAFIDNNLDAVGNEARMPVLRQILLDPPGTSGSNELAREVAGILATFQSKDPLHIRSYTLLDKEGRIVVDTAGEGVGELPAYFANDDSALNNFRLVLLTDLPSVSPVKFSSQTGNASLYFTVRVSDLEGKPLGGLLVQYDAAVLQDLVASNNGLVGADSFGVLFDEFHIHLAHGIAPETIFKSVALLEPRQLRNLQMTSRLPNLTAEELTTNLPSLEASLSSAVEDPFFTAEDVATGERANQVAVAAVETQPWIVAFFQPRDVFLAPVLAQTRLTLILAVVVTSLTILLALSAAQLIASPITRLTGVAERVSEGDLAAQAPVETGDEIGTLAEGFNLMTGRLRQTLAGLEQQVADRTQDLERRALQLQTAAQVAAEAAAIRDIQGLLDWATRRISDSFGFYHTGIFLMDELGEHVILQAASSEGGARMLARQHRLPVGRLGIVGFVGESGEPRIAHDVGADSVYFNNPDLPLTRSEMALPLKIAQQVIGVLDVQSSQEAAFTQEDIEVLQVLADQIALAIENARLLESSQQSLRELEALYRQQVQRAWEYRLSKPIAYRYNRIGVEAAEVTAVPEPAAFGDDRAASVHAVDERQLMAHIAIRGQRIGSLFLNRNPEQPPWRQDEITLLGELMNQFGLALENARLVEETQRHAERERTLSHLSARFTSSLDVETVLRTAAIELGQLPQVDEVTVQVDVAPPSDADTEDPEDERSNGRGTGPLDFRIA